MYNSRTLNQSNQQGDTSNLSHSLSSFFDDEKRNKNNKRRNKLNLTIWLQFYAFKNLHEGYLFGQSFKFDVSIEQASSSQTTANQRKPYVNNVYNLFDFM